MDLREVLRMKASPTLWAEVESLREQLERFREDAEEAQKVRGVLQLAAPAGHAVAHIKQMEADLGAAEAKLAEVEKERDEFKADTQRRWHALEAELAEKRASMGRVRELAKELSDGVADIEGDWAKRMQATADRVARLLSGDEDYIERHKLYAPPVTDDSLSGGE